eukprot:TRINITY_DN1498_c0_g2_i3.p1 TRINITY_DN1498_c0_g2~~TRINITY_DN1498_c0_g2_i3.p1  ORF type:complete len:244 (-),score=44.86 TRINITY_DN1498_c0_g2_i3:661-1392(-)
MGKVNNHANFLPLIAVVAAEPIHLVLKYIEQGNLQKLLDTNKGQLSWEFKANLLLQIASGMSHIHSCGVIHGDLKPQNVLIGENNKAYISDFGYSKTNLSSYITSIKGFAPCYSAVEVFKEEKMSKASDFYSFGVIMWQVVTERKPFSEFMNNKMELIAMLEKGVQPSFNFFPDDTPTLFYQLTSKCWSRKPEERPPFDHIITELQLLLKKEQTAVEQTWKKRNLKVAKQRFIFVVNQEISKY